MAKEQFGASYSGNKGGSKDEGGIFGELVDDN